MVSGLIIVALLFGALCVPTYAVETRESYVFSSYWVLPYQGKASGEINLDFSVTSSHPTTTIGISSIEIYRSNGTHVHTEQGTVENGLLRNGGNCAGTYIYQGTSGVSYYMAVRFYGVADGISETRTIVTDTIKAP